MASSVPALLAKIARFRPHVACFIGKGIWLHVERALILLKGDEAGNENAGIIEDPVQSSLGARSQEHVAEPTRTSAVLKDGRSAYFLLDGDTLAMADIERLPKTEPESSFDFCGVVKLEESRSDVSPKQETTESNVEDNAETTPGPSPLPLPMTRRGGISSAPLSGSKKARPAAAAFAYGLQPFKAVHDMVPYVRNSLCRLHEISV